MFDYTIYKYWLVKILLQREPLSVSGVQNEIDASENLCIFSQTQPIFSSSDPKGDVRNCHHLWFVVVRKLLH